MLYRTLLFLILTASFSCLARAQDRNDPFGREPASPVEMEMRVRRDIKEAEKEHQQNLDRAQEVAQISNEIRDAYKQNKSLGRTEMKKLDRLEKLTRHIRSDAGGADDRDNLMEKPPTQLEAALTRLAEVSEEMRKGVEKTPRQVISAPVIEHANEVLDIILYIRSQAH